MRIDPTKMTPEQIAQANKDWMNSQTGGTGSFKDDLRFLMSNDAFPTSRDEEYIQTVMPSPSMAVPKESRPFPRNDRFLGRQPSYGRNPYGPSLGMGRPSYGGIGSLFSQVAYMPEDVYKTGMQRFQQYMPMLGEYGGFGQYPRPAPPPTAMPAPPPTAMPPPPSGPHPPVTIDDNFAVPPTGGPLPPMTGGPRPDPYSTGGADAGGSTTTNQFPANQYYGMGRTGNPYGIGTGGSPYTQPYFQSSSTSPMNMGYGSNYRQGLYMPRDPYSGGYGGKGGYSPQPSSMGGKGGYGR